MTIITIHKVWNGENQPFLCPEGHHLIRYSGPPTPRSKGIFYCKICDAYYDWIPTSSTNGEIQK
jgi:hypothetical protein